MKLVVANALTLNEKLIMVNSIVTEIYFHKIAMFVINAYEVVDCLSHAPSAALSEQLSIEPSLPGTTNSPSEMPSEKLLVLQIASVIPAHGK